MSAISIVREILGADAGVKSLVSTRIYPIEAPQDGSFPAIVLHMSHEDDGEPRLAGSNRYPAAVFIADCLGRTYKDANHLGDAVSDSLIDYRGNVAGHRVDSCFHAGIDIFDRGEAGNIFRRRLSFSIRYQRISNEPPDEPEDSPPSD